MIKLTGDFYLDADDQNFILIEWKGLTQTDKKTGKESMSGQRYLYFKTFENLVQAVQIVLVRRGIARSKDMDEMRESFKETQEIIRAVCQSIDPREARKA